MKQEILIAFVNNAALLLALAIIYEFSYNIPDRFKKIMPLISGLSIGFIGVLIMSIAYKLADGAIFDTRSILIGTAGLIFGAIPTAIAAGITIIYRIIQGGAGAFAGSLVILSCAFIGLFWRKFLTKNKSTFILTNIYAFGLTLHVAMLLCMLTFPWEMAWLILSQITLPVLIIYPVATVLLTMLLLHQKDRREAMTLVRLAEARYRNLFNNKHTVMLITNPADTSIVDANPAAERFYGWSIKELRKMKVGQINITFPDEIKTLMRDAALHDANHFFFKHAKASGEIRDVEVYTGPIVIEGRTLLFSIVHHISNRIAAEKAEQESEKRFRTLVMGAPDAIFIQIDGKFAFVNPATLKLYGADNPEQLLGTSVFDRFHPDYWEQIRDRIRLLNEEKLSQGSIEQIHVKLDGSFVPVDVSGVPIHYEGADGAMVFVRDISERKRLETGKLEMEAQLRQQQKLEAIGTLAGGVAHEINNPINGIMNYAQLILDSLEKDLGRDPNDMIYAREIIHETERVSGIVENLLQFSRQEKKTHSYADVSDIIERTVSLVRTIIKKDQITLTIDIEENLPNMKCRSQQIQQVLMNLLTNAKDAVNEKYPRYDENKVISLTCRQLEREGRRWIHIVVSDNGCGIPKDMQDKIFEPFFSSKPKEMGTGLGLSISHGIVMDHHGTLTFETKEGEYTRFILELPVDNGWDLAVGERSTQ